MGFKVGSGYLLTALEAAHLRLETIRMEEKSHFCDFQSEGLLERGVRSRWPTLLPGLGNNSAGCVCGCYLAMVSFGKC